jgi:hypothetical protein
MADIDPSALLAALRDLFPAHPHGNRDIAKLIVNPRTGKSISIRTVQRWFTRKGEKEHRDLREPYLSQVANIVGRVITIEGCAVDHSPGKTKSKTFRRYTYRWRKFSIALETDELSRFWRARLAGDIWSQDEALFSSKFWQQYSPTWRPSWREEPIIYIKNPTDEQKKQIAQQKERCV